jgi:hypothetical protein
LPIVLKLWVNSLGFLVAMVEVAAGSQPAVATQEFDWRVRKLSDGTMVQMMARENSEAYKQNADVLLESIRATVQALAEGKIEFGNESGQIEAPAKNNTQAFRYAPNFTVGNRAAAREAAVAYCAETLGKFLMHHLLFRETYPPPQRRRIPIPLKLWVSSLCTIFYSGKRTRRRVAGAYLLC